MRFPPSRFSYAGIDPSVVASIISAAGSLAATATQTIGGIEMAKVKQAAEERTAQAALETERLATERAAADRAAAERSSRRASGGGRQQVGSTSVVPYVAGGVVAVVAVGVGIYLYRSRSRR